MRPLFVDTIHFSPGSCITPSGVYSPVIGSKNNMITPSLVIQIIFYTRVQTGYTNLFGMGSILCQISELVSYFSADSKTPSLP